MKAVQDWSRVGLTMSLAFIAIGAGMAAFDVAWSLYFVNYWIGSATVYAATLRRSSGGAWK